MQVLVRMMEENRVLCITFLVLLLLGILCQVMAGMTCRRLIRETERMPATKNKFLCQCKLKFANCYYMNAGVANPAVFVEKMMGEVTAAGIRISGLRQCSGQLILLSVAAAGLASFREILNGETVGHILPYYIAAFLGLYLFFSISGWVNLQEKQERLKTHLTDYLENHMIHKLKRSAQDWERLTGEAISYGRHFCTAAAELPGLPQKAQCADLGDHTETEGAGGTSGTGSTAWEARISGTGNAEWEARIPETGSAEWEARIPETGSAAWEARISGAENTEWEAELSEREEKELEDFLEEFLV